MSHRFLEVDVFATGPFTGNPLAVVADADDLTDEQMQAIARWTNFSETTFLLTPTTPEADYRVRIFTLDAEYPFAGHPTLGSARAWLDLGGTPSREGVVVQECGAGLVPVRVDGETLAFATPPVRRGGAMSDDELADAVRMLAIEPGDVVAHAWGVNGPPWCMIQLADDAAVRAVRPIGDRPGAHIGLVGLTGGTDPAYEVRAICDGIEDPVTGSLNGAIAQWLRSRDLVPDRYTAVQGSQVKQAGRIAVEDDGTDIWVGGRADIRVRGTLGL